MTTRALKLTKCPDNFTGVLGGFLLPCKVFVVNSKIVSVVVDEDAGRSLAVEQKDGATSAVIYEP